MNKFKITVLSIVAFVALSSIWISDVSAVDEDPNLYFKTTAESFAPGSNFSVGVFVDSNKPINALHLEIGYSIQTLEFLNFNTNPSIIDFWRNDPEALDDGIIKLEGGTAKAFEGKAGEIIQINFRAKREGLAQWSFRKAELYYADGEGTPAKSDVSPMSLTISPFAQLTSVAQEDKQAPVFLDVKVIKDPADNGQFAVFRAVDKESGLKTVYMRIKKWFIWEDWQRATNPVRLSAGVWSFQIKAIDNQGNASKQTVYVKTEVVKKSLYFILLLAVIACAYYFVKSRRRRKML